MKTSENFTNLFKDIVKAQAEFPTMPKDTTGYGYKYTNFDTIVSTIKPILAKNNLGYMQPVTNGEDGKFYLTTIIFNAAGEYIEESISLPSIAMAKTNEAQNLGASITYMRRYALCSMLGITCDEDSDGTTARPTGTPAKPNDKKTGDLAKQATKPASKPAAAPAKKNYTPEQANTCGEILKWTFPDGSPVFSEEDKNKYRELLMADGSNTVKILGAEKDKRLNNWQAPAPVQQELY